MEEVHLNTELLFDHDEEFEDHIGIVNCDSISNEKNLQSRSICPIVGLEFESFDEARDFYNVYGREQGFGIRVSNSWFRSKRKERYRAKLSCSSAGFKKESKANNPRPETRTGCPAMIIIKLVDAKRWRVVEVELEHNHPVSPEDGRFFKSHKKMILAAQKPVQEVHTIKVYKRADFSVMSEGQTDTVDCSSSDKHLELKEVDWNALYNYFCRMKLTNPNFFYLMDLNDQGRLRNVFWADFSSRVAYDYFCDTVAIDSTSLANRFEIPLICIVGVNHHGHLVLLGCAFIAHETVDNFVWILRSWLTCMLGLRPQVIITDQSRSLRSAVSEVLPEAHHCFSLWYIMQRVPERLGGLRGYDVIRKQLINAVYNLLKIAEFETAWNEMIMRHKLTDHRWLQTLYEDRERWVPIYLKEVFLAGLVPVREDEAVKSAFFEGYVHKHTSFKEFLDKYDLALYRNRMNEAMADLESRSNPELKTRCSFELQLAKVYTKDIFRKFQCEVEGMYSCFNTRQVNADGPVLTYVVKERVEVEGSEKEVRSYEVVYEAEQGEIRCICSLFNYKGYLCRHVLNVLNYIGMEEIPSRYILPRWRKDYKSSHCSDNYPNDTGDPLHSGYDLYRRGIRVVEEGSRSKEGYMAAVQGLEGLLSREGILEDDFLQVMGKQNMGINLHWN